MKLLRLSCAVGCLLSATACAANVKDSGGAAGSSGAGGASAPTETLLPPVMATDAARKVLGADPVKCRAHRCPHSPSCEPAC